MISRIIIRGYRRFRSLDIEPIQGMNIVVGDNESGKSTLLEAIALALTNKVNGRWTRDELNPFWFNVDAVREFFEKYGTSEQVAPPTIRIELFLSGDSPDLQQLRGVYNSRHEDDCPGVVLTIEPDDEFESEFEEYLASDPPRILPVEYYRVQWRSFADQELGRQPRALSCAYIDSRTIRSTSGVDHHTREMLSEYLDSKERAQVSVAHRRSKQQITSHTLTGINQRISQDNPDLHDRDIGIQMDQSSRTSWETGVIPQVEGIPFSMAGQGQQAAIKVALAMSRTVDRSPFVLIEEPENHLSHTSLSRLAARIRDLAGEDQQMFVATHSSFVLNRLGLDRLLLLHNGDTMKLTDLDDSTVEYFQKLAGYDTLRIALASKVVFVEGPSDELIFQRAFRDAKHMDPVDAGIDVIAMGGLTAKRALKLCAALGRRAVVLQDNDGLSVDEVREPVEQLLEAGKREMRVSDPTNGPTLEPQLIAANSEATLRSVLGLRQDANVEKWMTREKTEAALRILKSQESIAYPAYITEAIDLVA
ncbi:AAA family ATPase [Svornostia abyssi]|uniref:AAA family ATPase n=1 Tax=Svornostia abyssi TaxID=2898438 RepID=A0ABY5PB10_9ACTN|nr:AAA family ATPase [Parviterribacteraceae bacterium J379]